MSLRGILSCCIVAPGYGAFRLGVMSSQRQIAQALALLQNSCKIRDQRNKTPRRLCCLLNSRQKVATDESRSANRSTEGRGRPAKAVVDKAPSDHDRLPRRLYCCCCCCCCSCCCTRRGVARTGPIITLFRTRCSSSSIRCTYVCAVGAAAAKKIIWFLRAYKKSPAVPMT